MFCNTFSERGKRQNEEVQRFKETVHANENEENFCLFCKDLIQCIGSRIAATTRSVDSREKSYQLFYAKRVSQLKNCWDAFSMALHLPQADPVWTQTVNRLLFNQMLVTAIQQDRKQKDRPQEPSPSCHQQLGVDEENIIRYMAGYIPFKLLKVYKR